MKRPTVLAVYTIVLVATVYRVPYGMRDLEDLLKIFNDLHKKEMNITISSIKQAQSA
jgi:hypothetical protein